MKNSVNTVQNSRIQPLNALQTNPALVNPAFSDGPALPPNQPCLIRANQGILMETPGEKASLKLPSSKTAGRVTTGTFEVDVNAGPPPHIHNNEDEIFMVQSGAIEIFVNGQTVVARAGDMAYLSRGEAHGFRGLDIGEENRFNIIIAPGGFENFFARWVTFLQNGAPDLQKAAVLAGEYGIELLPGAEFAPIALKPQSKIVRSGEAPVLNVLGDRAHILLSAAETGGRYTLVRVEGPRDSGPPPHIHENEDELFLIEEGTFEFTLGQETVCAYPGDVVWAPRGFVHTFRRLTDGARMAVFMTPGGMDRFFNDCHDLEQIGALNPESVIQLCAQYGMELLLPREDGASFQS